MPKDILSQLIYQIRRNFKILLLLGVIVLFFVTPLRGLLDQETLLALLQRIGPWTVPVFISTYALVAILGLPITIHTLVGGVVFGLLWGTIWSTLAATLGAVGAFCLTRYLFQDWAIAKLGNHKLLYKWNQTLQHSAFNLVLSLRFAPIAPFNIINFLLALTSIDLKTYTLATFIGVIPGTIAYTWLGSSGKKALQDSDLLQFFIASCFLIVLSVAPLLLKRWQQLQKFN